MNKCLKDNNRDYLEFRYISPYYKDGFKKNSNYILTIVRTDKITDKINLYKIHLTNIDNVSEKIRAYPFYQVIQEDNLYTTLHIKLYEYDSKNNLLVILFSGSVDSNQLKYDTKYPIKLREVIDPKRYLTYKDDSTFVDELFYNILDKESENFCIIFLSRLKDNNEKYKIKPIILDTNRDIYVFDRYQNSLIKEYTPYINTNTESRVHDKNYTHNKKFISNILRADVKDIRNTFIKEYQVYEKMYEITSSDKIITTNRMDLNYRPYKYDPYKNNIINNPVDGRIRGFRNRDTKFYMNNREYNLADFINKNDRDQISGGSGFICRMTPQDYQRIYQPYRGSLKRLDNSKNICVLCYDNEYYIPPSVEERDILSVVLGNFTYAGSGVGAGNRFYPEVLKPQPDTRLIMYLIIVGPLIDNSIEITNHKLVKGNKSVWMEQGEEIGVFNYAGGHVIVCFNREIDFNEDIAYYSSRDKKLDVYIKCRDTIGEIV